MGEVQRRCELEPVVGPVQTAAICDGQTEDAERLIRVVGVFVERALSLTRLIVVIAIATVAVATIIGIVVARAVVVASLPRIVALVNSRHT